MPFRMNPPLCILATGFIGGEFPDGSPSSRPAMCVFGTDWNLDTSKPVILTPGCEPCISHRGILQLQSKQKFKCRDGEVHRKGEGD